MSDIDTALRTQLHVLEAEMQAAGLWDATPPSDEALQSSVPFMFDTLRIEQWLQWVFVPRMHALLDAQAALPAKCDIHPLAEYEWQGKALTPWPARVLACLQQIDAMLSAQGASH
ncbi:hypothetical protein CCO03_13110 [Comamonas serinivorans]|uniref:YqcC-like domain-containing protein n=1 Tax=Comamonas serinivorans TaxID=1082851 RepID=A0A1Y0EPT4_9BURK|nr:YqcC family protein [Comamonas serinivorans]ARU05498.1 hypothetical protein CCO03_13110 [Comamonas serinivorans]